MDVQGLFHIKQMSKLPQKQPALRAELREALLRWEVLESPMCWDPAV